MVLSGIVKGIVHPSWVAVRELDDWNFNRPLPWHRNGAVNVNNPWKNKGKGNSRIGGDWISFCYVGFKAPHRLCPNAEHFEDARRLRLVQETLRPPQRENIQCV